MKIVVTDTDQGLLNALDAGLNSIGCQVVSTNDADEAFQALKGISESEDPVFITTDFQDKKTDGLALIQQVQHLYPNVRAVLLATGVLAQICRMDHPHVQVIEKPFTVEKLKKMILSDMKDKSGSAVTKSRASNRNKGSRSMSRDKIMELTRENERLRKQVSKGAQAVKEVSRLKAMLKDSENRYRRLFADMLRKMSESSERRWVEDLVTSREERYRRIFDLMPLGISIYRFLHREKSAEAAFAMTDANPSFERLMDCPKDEMVGKSVEELLGARASHLLELFSHTLKTGLPISAKNVIFKTDAACRVVVFAMNKDFLAAMAWPVEQPESQPEPLTFSFS